MNVQKGKKRQVGAAEEELDAMDSINELELEVFVERFLMDGDFWKTWIHPTTSATYTISIEAATTLCHAKADFEACFKLIEFTSSADYKKSKDGWKPRSKKNEMKLLDLKYLLVKRSDGKVEGFCSFMPTYEDNHAVIYCYEIHLGSELQGTGLGKIIMGYIEVIGSNIPDVSKIMLTVFLSNEKGLNFYKKLGYDKDEFSPAPKVLRNGTKVEVDYLILSKPILRPDATGKS